MSKIRSKTIPKEKKSELKVSKEFRGDKIFFNPEVLIKDTQKDFLKQIHSSKMKIIVRQKDRICLLGISS
jgi:hypothetical protein